MMRLVRGLIPILLLSATITGAQENRVSSLIAKDFGIYESDIEMKEPPATDGVGHNRITNVRLVKETRTVPMRKGIEFGFSYAIAGTPNGSMAPLRIVMLYPPSGIVRPGAQQPVRRSEYTAPKRIGDWLFLVYSLDEDRELIPGDWTFEIWFENRKLTSQTFTVVE